MQYAWSDQNPDEWDRNRDGVLEGRQHHTLDMELFGPSSWLEGFYLAALKAAAEMADFLGDTAAAAETPVRRRRAKAVVKIDEPSDDAAGKAAGDSSAQPAVKRNVRRPRRKKEEAETKELFAFYEQSLF